MRAARGTRRSKYGAIRTTVDGITFDSKREAQRYRELKLLEKAGEIWDLELQPEFPLYVPSTSGSLTRAARAAARGGLIKVGVYRGDFKYHDHSSDGSTHVWIVEDVKGFRTPLYRWKRKHVMAQYGIEIREV